MSHTLRSHVLWKPQPYCMGLPFSLTKEKEEVPDYWIDWSTGTINIIVSCAFIVLLTKNHQIIYLAKMKVFLLSYYVKLSANSSWLERKIHV